MSFKKYTTHHALVSSKNFTTEVNKFNLNEYLAGKLGHNSSNVKIRPEP